MRCEDIDDFLDTHANVEPTAAERQAIDEHLATCTECSGAWAAARALGRYRTLPTPRPSPTLLARVAAAKRPAATPARSRAPSWLAAGVGGALAAGIAVIAVYFAIDHGRPPTTPAVTMSLHETRDVNVNIDSAEALMDVEVRVVLAGAIELEGFRGRSEIKWRTDLEAGINRLTLPIVASDGSGGKVLITVGSGAAQRAFVMQIDVAEGNVGATEI